MGFFSAQILQREICFYYGTQIDQQTTFYCLAKAERKSSTMGKQKSDPTTTCAPENGWMMCYDSDVDG
jgi:hypothetical protein